MIAICQVPIDISFRRRPDDPLRAALKLSERTRTTSRSRRHPMVPRWLAQATNQQHQHWQTPTAGAPN